MTYKCVGGTLSLTQSITPSFTSFILYLIIYQHNKNHEILLHLLSLVSSQLMFAHLLCVLKLSEPLRQNAVCVTRETMTTVKLLTTRNCK